MTDSDTPELEDLPDDMVLYCGTPVYRFGLQQQEPLLTMAEEAFEMFGQNPRIRTISRTAVPSIPVYFHVLWNTAEQNISDDQIYSQIDALNDSFRSLNSDILVETPQVFQTLIGDPKIQFELAGITRTQTSKSEFSISNDEAKFASLGGHDVITPATHLNFWVVPKFTEDYAGYASFPYGPASKDGIVMVHDMTGSTGTATHQNYALGRTAVHEMGHYFNLHHIWGDEPGCSGSDFVADTPNQADYNSGRPSFPHITCNNGPNGDLFVNYMDYSWDAVTVMFTEGQCARMDLALKNARGQMMNKLATGPAQKLYTPASTPFVTPAGVNLGRQVLSDKSLGRYPLTPPRRFS